MSVFNEYADFYDLLYQDKAFSDEANHIHELIQEHRPGSSSILELGCGTGNHAIHLVEHYNILGVDLSTKMIRQAKKKQTLLPSNLASKLTFSTQDLRTLQLDENFDVILALFHVISYQVSNADVASAFHVARKHLKPRGLFLFDCWYGPAVLHHPPSERVKRLNDGKTKLTRVAKPQMHPNENSVDVKYQLIAERNGSVEKYDETHHVRYFFKPEIEYFLSHAGFDLVSTGVLCSPQEPGFDTWGVLFIATAG